MVVKKEDPTIYMATHTVSEPDIGELRFIARLNNVALPSEYPFGDVSKTVGSSSTVEGSDVFIVDGQTRSKFYSSERFIDDTVVRYVKDSFTEETLTDGLSIASTATLRMPACL
jgi:rhamnogalacturonan endolyase